MRSLFFGISLAASTAFAGTPVEPPDQCCEIDLWTGEGVSLIGNWLLPELTYQATAGSSTTDPERLAVGHHDPDRHGITQQSIEFSLSARLSENAFIFANYSAKIDHEDHWTDELEEVYLSLDDLPLGLRFKGGRFYTQFGYQNRLHAHAFDFVDQYLASGRLVGEDSLGVNGAELAIPIASHGASKWKDLLTVSFGAVPDEEEENEEEFGPEAAFEGEAAGFQDYVGTLDYTVTLAASEHSQVQFGVSGAWGKNNFERHTALYGAHFQYLWRADDHKDCLSCEAEHHTSEYFRWRTEVIVRHFDAVSSPEEEEAEEPEVIVIPGQPEVRRTERQLVGTRFVQGGLFVPIYRNREVVVQKATPARVERTEAEPQTKPVRDDFTDAGFYTTLSYGFPGGRFSGHLRGEYVSGVNEAGLVERWRVSPSIAWRPPTRLPIYFRLQYNYDHSPSFGDEHSVWAQFTFQWGDCCAHE